MQELYNGQNRFLKIDRHDIADRKAYFTIEGNPLILVRRMDQIAGLLLRGKPTFGQLVDLFYQLIEVIPLSMVELELEHIVRCRPGYLDGGRYYSNVADISYNPYSKRGRFNFETEPIFYGSMPSGAKNGNCSLTTLIESDKDLLRKDDYISDTKYATLGRWDIYKSFHVLNLSYIPETQMRNPLINKLNQHTITNCKNILDQGAAEIFTMFSLFISKVMSLDTESNGYLVTNAFKLAINWFYGVEMKGFLYSSGVAEHNGINVALSKEVVDEGYIKLTGACVYKVESHPIYLERKIFPCSNFARTDHYGNFQLKVNPNLHLFG